MNTVQEWLENTMMQMYFALGERVSGEGMIEAIIKAWDKAEFEEGRHTQRVEKINALSKIGNCRA